MEKDIVIIGAGITGMTCAYELHRKGKNIQVLECQNRIGGQINHIGIGVDLQQFLAEFKPADRTHLNVQERQ